MGKKRHVISVIDAVDNLARMAEIDLLLEDVASQDWLDPQNAPANQEKAKETFLVLHRYMRNLYENEKSQLKEPQLQRGLRAIMLLAGEAAQKLDRYTSLFQGRVSKLKEYQDLTEYYQTKIIKRLHKPLETEILRGEQEEEVPEEGVDAQALKDLERVRKDRDYELFYIRKQDGNPFFTPHLLRHLRLVGEFDETLTSLEGEDPLLKIRALEDKDSQLSAKEILEAMMPTLDLFYHEALRHKERPFVAALNKAAMSLFLAANPRNLAHLAQVGSGKNCRLYFADFHHFLREALSSEEYKHALSMASEPILIHTAHEMCCHLFLRKGARREAIEFIRYLSMRGGQASSSLDLAHILSEEDEKIRALLSQYPHGPLLKLLDDFRTQEERGGELKGFDPFAQGNIPCHLYSFTYDDADVAILRIPAPIRQEVISKVEIVPEFYAFLHGLQTTFKGQRHLLFYLGNRTSWQEHARCAALEQLSKDPAYAKTLTVITLPKDSEFYNQTGSYQDLNRAEQFITAFKEQIAGGEACGYYFPAKLPMQEVEAFAAQSLEMIHRHFFASQDLLSRKNRLDFIEIFTQFLIVKMLTLLQPDSVSFTSKDAVDLGAAQNATLFAFLRLLNNPEPWKLQEIDFLLWLLNAPALLIRERAIDPAPLNRALGALSLLQPPLLDQVRPLLGPIASKTNFNL